MGEKVHSSYSCLPEPSQLRDGSRAARAPISTAPFSFDSGRRSSWSSTPRRLSFSGVVELRKRMAK
jgi:hypothetical protein